jgi:hypothetical protein
MKSRPPRRLPSLRLIGLVLVAVLGLGAEPPAPSPGAVSPPREVPPALPEGIMATKPTTLPPSPPPDEPPDPTALFAQLELLQEFLSLSPDELRKIQGTIALIERLSPEERSQMRRRLAQLKLDLRHLDGELDPFAAHLEATAREDFRRFWISLPPSERMRLQSRFASLPASERGAWVRQRLEVFRAHEKAILERLQASAAGQP